MRRRLTAADLHPQLRKVFRWVPNPPIRRPWALRLMQSGTSRFPAPTTPEQVEHRFVPLGEGAGVHVFTPRGARVRPALLWIHGGGYVLGSAAQDHARCIAWARELDMVVLSAEYRTAPAAPFPGPLLDVRAAWDWALAHADREGFDPARIVIGGQSAGGGLAAALVQLVHDQGGAQPVGQWLFCPMLDDRTAADHSLDRVRHFLWDNRSNRVGWRSYLGTEPGALQVPDHAVPSRRADLSGLAPAWIGVGDIELFHDEDRDYAAALTAAGVQTVLDVVPGAPHAFESLVSGADVTRAYLARAQSWLADRVAAPA